MEFKQYTIYLKSPAEKEKIAKSCFETFLSSYELAATTYLIEQLTFKKVDLELLANLYYRQYASDAQRRKYEQCIEERKMGITSKQKKRKKSMPKVKTEIDTKLLEKQLKEYTATKTKAARIFKKYQASDFDEEILRRECEIAKCSIFSVISYVEETAIADMSKENIAKYRSIKEVSESNLSEEKSIKQWMQQQKRIISILDFLLSKTSKEALTFLTEQGKRYKDPYFLFHSVKDRINQYVLYFGVSPEKQEFLLEVLAQYYIEIQNRDKIQREFSLERQQARAQNKARKQAIIKEFRKMVMSGESINIYCEKQGIPRQTMTENMRSIRAEYPEIFQEYLEYRQQSEEYYRVYKPYVVKLLSFLADSEKTFEELDYYLSIGLAPTCLNKCAKQICTKDENTLISTFVNRLNKLSPIKEIAIYEESQFVQMNGQVVEVTINQKQEILSFLKEHNVPLSLKIYQQARKRYLMGSLRVGVESTSSLNPQKKITK